MSLLGKAVGGLTKAVGQVVGGPVGYGLQKAGSAIQGKPKAASMTPVPTSALTRTLGGTSAQIRTGVATGVATNIATSLLPNLFGGGRSLTGSSCGCDGSNGRDPCTRQRTSSQPAPDATFFGGCCPPGRVLRRRPWARDICIKQPKMNPFNPSALARADRRLTQFARRSTVILKDMGFDVSRHRKVKIKAKRRRR